MNYSMVEQQLIDYRPVIINFVKGRLRNLCDAEDIVQKAYESAFKNIKQFRGDSSPGTWLTGIAINILRKHSREKLKNDELFIPITEYIEDFTADTRCKEPIEIIIGQNELITAFNSLTEKQQKILWAIFVDGLDYKQTADKFGVPIGTVKSRVNRAREAIALLVHH